MPITAEHVGRSYPPGPPVEVTASNIRAFAAALGDDNPAYAGDAPIAPPTYVAAAASTAWEAMFADADLGLQLRRTVHADQRFTFDRALRPGDVVTAALTITAVRARGSVETVAVSVDVRSGEERVCLADSTFVHNREGAR